MALYPSKGQEAELDEYNFDLEDGKNLIEGQENVIGEFEVPPQEVYRWGYGNPRDERNQGFAFADIRDDADEEIEGELWVVQTDATGDERQVVKRFNLDTIRGDPTDINSQRPLPEQASNPLVGENSRLRLIVVPRSDYTLDHTNSKVRLPTTRAKAREV